MGRRLASASSAGSGVFFPGFAQCTQAQFRDILNRTQQALQAKEDTAAASGGAVDDGDLDVVFEDPVEEETPAAKAER